MRIAIFSDVHGNLSALEAVLADIARQGVDRVIFAGDLCFFGPRPAECLRVVRAATIDALFGNTDDWVLKRQEPPARLVSLAEWTADQLAEDERQWLAGLPFSQRLTATGQAHDALLIVHANPLDVNQVIFPSESDQLSRYGRLRQSNDELGQLLHRVDAAGVVFGHLHVPGERAWGSLPLYNISSLSVPGDGDPRAKYGIFTWSDGGWQFERRRVAFEAEEETAALRASRLPGWKEMVKMMEQDGFLSQNV